MLCCTHKQVLQLTSKAHQNYCLFSCLDCNLNLGNVTLKHLVVDWTCFVDLLEIYFQVHRLQLSLFSFQETFIIFMWRNQDWTSLYWNRWDNLTMYVYNAWSSSTRWNSPKYVVIKISKAALAVIRHFHVSCLPHHSE